MADVLLLSAAPVNDPERPHARDQFKRLRDAADHDRYNKHRVTDNPRTADIILFVENRSTTRAYLNIRQHPFYDKYRNKCFLFSRFDYPIPFLPGIYPAIEKRWYRSHLTRSGPYLKALTNDFIEARTIDSSAYEYLYSFSGQSDTHPLRKALFRLEFDRQYLFDTSDLWPYGELSESKREELQRRYANVCHQSKFILCPRGRGVSSMRLFETLRIGRAPVIISDQWVPPTGPDWETFSIRVAEDNVDRIPEILLQHEHRAEEMGRRAKQAWDDWFSKEAVFHSVTEWCLDIMSERTLPAPIHQLSIVPQLLSPTYLKHTIRQLIS